jgi:hypothetical protein
MGDTGTNRQRNLIRATAIASVACCAAWSLAERPDDGAFATTRVKELNADDVQTRERAEDSLRGWCRGQADRVLTLIDGQSSAEQRDRLLSLARSVFDTSPRAAMGVSFGVANVAFGLQEEEAFDGGIPIAGPVKGFDSENVLKSGDLLLSIEGVRIRTNREARTQILSHDPGQVVRLEIERDGKVLQLPLKLGFWSNLNSRANIQRASDPSGPELDNAWRARLARVNPALLSLDTQPVLRPVPNASAWAEAERLATEPAQTRLVQLPQSQNLRLGPGVDNNQRQVLEIGIDGRMRTLNTDRNGNVAVADLRPSGTTREVITNAPSDEQLRPSRQRQRFENLTLDAQNEVNILQLQRRGLMDQAAMMRETMRLLPGNDANRRGMDAMLQRIETEIAVLEDQMEQARKRGQRQR